MRKLATGLLAPLLVLLLIAPPAGADDRETKVEGSVVVPNSFTQISGLKTGEEVKVEWKAVVGKTATIKNRTTGTKAKCTVLPDTDTTLPSNVLWCVVTESNIPDIGVNDLLRVGVNFSPASFTGDTNPPGLRDACGAEGGLGSDQACIVCIKNSAVLRSDIALAETKAEGDDRKEGSDDDDRRETNDDDDRREVDDIDDKRKADDDD